jgi:hypothetical protein
MMKHFKMYSHRLYNNSCSNGPGNSFLKKNAGVFLRGLPRNTAE